MLEVFLKRKGYLSIIVGSFNIVKRDCSDYFMISQVVWLERLSFKVVGLRFDSSKQRFFEAMLSWRKAAELSPATLYTLRRTTAGLMKT